MLQSLLKIEFNIWTLLFQLLVGFLALFPLEERVTQSVGDQNRSVDILFVDLRDRELEPAEGQDPSQSLRKLHAAVDRHRCALRKSTDENVLRFPV